MFCLSCTADCTAPYINHPHPALRLADVSAGARRSTLGAVVTTAARACPRVGDKTTAPRMPRAAAAIVNKRRGTRVPGPAAARPRPPPRSAPPPPPALGSAVRTGPRWARAAAALPRAKEVAKGQGVSQQLRSASALASALASLSLKRHRWELRPKIQVGVGRRK
ncbi:unnamed protein product [Coccothraustes coccothraustes]